MWQLQCTAQGRASCHVLCRMQALVSKCLRQACQAVRCTLMCATASHHLKACRRRTCDPTLCQHSPGQVLQVSRDKKVELERLQAEHAAAKQAHSAAERKCEQLERELASLKKRVAEAAQQLTAAKAAQEQLGDVARRLASAPTGFLAGTTPAEKVRGAVMRS